jgi:esterase
VSQTEVTTAEQLEYFRLAGQVAGMDLSEVILPDDRRVSVNGVGVHYLDWGGSGPHMLLLHGAALTAHTWDLVCLAIRQRVHCLAVDARGHGDSDWSADGEYGLEAQVADVEALVEKLELDQFVLVGMSMGGGTAIAYAGQNTRKLRGLVIVDTGPDTTRPGAAHPARDERVRDFIAGPAELDSVEDFVQRAVEFNPARDPRLLRRSLRYNLRQLPDGRWTWKYDRQHFLRPRTAVERDVRQAILSEAIARIACPTLIVRGAQSTNFTDDAAAAFAQSLPDGRWRRVENAGHTVQGDNPKGLVEVLNPFLSELGV